MLYNVYWGWVGMISMYIKAWTELVSVYWWSHPTQWMWTGQRTIPGTTLFEHWCVFFNAPYVRTWGDKANDLTSLPNAAIIWTETRCWAQPTSSSSSSFFSLLWLQCCAIRHYLSYMLLTQPRRQDLCFFWGNQCMLMSVHLSNKRL